MRNREMTHELAHHKTGPADIFVAEIDLAAANEGMSF